MDICVEYLYDPPVSGIKHREASSWRASGKDVPRRNAGAPSVIS